MNQAQLNAIKERVAKASPGPWESEETTEGHIDIFNPNQDYAICQTGNETYDCLNDGDTEFIKHAITDVPALVAEVERLKADKERWFKRESSLQKEIERLQAIEIESDSKLCEQKKEIELLSKAPEKVMEVEAPNMEGYETCAYKIAREALGGEADE